MQNNEADEIQNHHSYASAENGLLTAYFDAEDAPITTDNFVCALFLTKNGVFVPIANLNHLLSILGLNPAIFDQLDQLRIGDEVNATVNNAPCKAKLIKLFSSQIAMLQFIAAYGSKCVSEYVNLSTVLSSLFKQSVNTNAPSSTFVTQTKVCVEGLNQKLNSMEDLVETYKKELYCVKSEINEHLNTCPGYVNKSSVDADLLSTPAAEKEMQFVAFPPNEKLLWMDVDAKQKIINLFNSLINQVEDFPTELALNMWGVRILVANDISTKTVQFRQDPPLIIKDLSGYELFTKVLFRWHCAGVIESGRVMVDDYCQNKDHWDALLGETFYSEELPKILNNIRKKTDSYKKIKSDTNYDPLYYQLLAKHGKPTPDWTVASESLPVAYRLGYDETFEVQSPMLTLIRNVEEGKTNTKEFETLCRSLHYTELSTGSASPSKKSTSRKPTARTPSLMPEIKITSVSGNGVWGGRRPGSGRKPKNQSVITVNSGDTSDDDDPMYIPRPTKKRIKTLGF